MSMGNFMLQELPKGAEDWYHRERKNFKPVHCLGSCIFGKPCFNRRVCGKPFVLNFVWKAYRLKSQFTKSADVSMSFGMMELFLRKAVYPFGQRAREE